MYRKIFSKVKTWDILKIPLLFPIKLFISLFKSYFLIKKFKPKKAILTNLSPVLDY